MSYRIIFLFILLAILPDRSVHAFDLFMDPAPPRIQKYLDEPGILKPYIYKLDRLKQLYALREFRVTWTIKNNSRPEIADKFIDYLVAYLNKHGLREEDYPFDALRDFARDESEDGPILTDMLMTDLVLRVTGHMMGERVKLSRIYEGWSFRRNPRDLPQEFKEAIEKDQVDDFLIAVEPKHPAYHNLLKGLVAYRAIAEKGGWPIVPFGAMIEPGQSSTRIPAIRARLMAENYLPQDILKPKDAKRYDKLLLAAVKAFQRRNGLHDDGVLGRATLVAMNTGVNERIGQILANLERWRSMPDDFGNRYVMMNIPGAELDTYVDGQKILSAPTVVGRNERRTPFINSLIDEIVINPPWFVPDTIIKEDFIPKLREDPLFLEKKGIRIRNADEDDPHGTKIDWANVDAKSFDLDLRQDPGDKNSLGSIKFDFENPFAVYMHGTPQKELFDKDDRSLSSGCARVKEPEKLAEIILKDTNGWGLPVIEGAIRLGKTRYIPIKNPMPVYFVYWSAIADQNGVVDFRNDIYGLDQLFIDTIKKQSIWNKPLKSKETIKAP